jgi:hypothetical protein
MALINENIREITEATEQTLIGVNRSSFPKGRANCFSALLDDGSQVKILNFGIEKLEVLVGNGVVDWPVKVVLHSESPDLAYVCDSRIPDEWYNDICTICCPQKYLPEDVRLKQLRDIQSGNREETTTESGLQFVKVIVKATSRKLNAYYTVENS